MPIRDTEKVEPKNGYVTWSDEKSRALAMTQLGKAVQVVTPVVRTVGSSAYWNVAPNNVSVRDSYDRQDYNSFRSGEAMPSRPKDVIGACMRAYDESPILRNVIDLMADFCIQGMDINHPNERVEKFYKNWFKKVNALERSERFVNLFYRAGQVIGRRYTARLNRKDEDRLRRSVAGPDIVYPPDPDTLKREIPLRYTFFDPCSIELYNEDISTFLGPDYFSFCVQIPKTIRKLMGTPNSPSAQILLNELPPDIQEILKTGGGFIPLDKSKTFAYYYKRDDWQAWAIPMAAPLLKDFAMLEKMKLADLSALDGAISCIRVWKLGSLEHKVMPSEGLMLRLAESLTNNIGGGVMDLVWGPDIELIETSTEVHKFLGDTKYAPVLKAIYQGLGIPSSLTGESNPGGFTNNYISLKTLTERLEYGRNMLINFWDAEIKLVQKAMGFRYPATVVFDRLLTDEASEKQLLLNLADRDLISVESIQEQFGLTPEIEQVRLRREARRRKNGHMPRKASPFHDANFTENLAKIFAGTGAYAPSELGLELQENQGDKAPNELSKPETDKPKGQPGQGRPPLKKDQTKRKKKVVKPRTSAEFVQLLAQVEKIQGDLSGMLSPLYLSSLEKKTLRELTTAEMENFERFKFIMLCQFKPDEPVTEEKVGVLLDCSLQPPEFVDTLLKCTKQKYVQKYGKEPTLEVMRRFQAASYAVYLDTQCTEE